VSELAVIALVSLASLFLFLGLGLWVAISLTAVAFITMSAFTSLDPLNPIARTMFDSVSDVDGLAALPMFIWMGEILFRTRLSQDMFAGLAPWLRWLPGRLLHVNVLGCGIFAAVSGSSAATAATIGRMSIPELRSRGYPERMILGTLAGSATLGFLIPPSIILIVYGVSADISIARLFIAGVIPGLMLVLMFMGFVGAWALMNPGAMPPRDPHMPIARRFLETARLLPVVGLIIAVIGSIYAGVATPTEAASLGVIGALILSAATGALSWGSFRSSLVGATRTTCMICLILAGAAFLKQAMGFAGLPRDLADWIATMDLPRGALILALTLFFIVMGCFLDGISIVVLTTSIILPMADRAGIDAIWFGIYLVVVVEMSQITPPVGFNLFVLQGLTGRNILSIAWAALPFFVILCLAVLLLSLFPGIATWLPAQMTG